MRPRSVSRSLEATARAASSIVVEALAAGVRKVISISARASAAPRQKWTPPPKVSGWMLRALYVEPAGRGQVARRIVVAGAPAERMNTCSPAGCVTPRRRRWLR
mgnify:CR=1 FL=1